MTIVGISVEYCYQERLELARERMAVEKSRNNWLQERSVYLGQQHRTLFVAAPLPTQPRYVSTPALRAMQTNHHPVDEKAERMGGPDLTSSRHATSQAIAQLEYKRALRLWANSNEKVRRLCTCASCKATPKKTV